MDEEWAQLVLQALFEMRADVARIRELLEEDEKRRMRTPDERAVYDETTRRLETWLGERGVPVGRDRASYDERTRLFEEALERRRARAQMRRESS